MGKKQECFILEYEINIVKIIGSEKFYKIKN